MRRAVLILLLAAALPHSTQAGRREGPMDAIGTVDYNHGPRFKVGDWIKYRTRGNSLQGYRTDYTVTLLIAGEEMWWGEKCFWVETRTSSSEGDPEITASLMSYGVFEDSLPSRRYTLYVRKTLEGLDDQGRYVQQPFRRAESDIKRRLAKPEPVLQIDTLGVGRAEVPNGVFDALKVRRVFREALTAQEGDSTVYFERVEDHTYWWSDQIPITRLVKIDQDNIQRRRAWMIGESGNAPLNVAEHATGVVELLDFGSGMKSSAIPERFQRPVSEQHPAPVKPARRPAGRRG
jgi:hypothetical protein